MEDKPGFEIEVTSPYKEFWRYNLALTCGCFDAQNVRTDFAATEDTVADVGADLTKAPEEYSRHRTTVLTVPPADHLLLYVYIIPHTLPRGNDIADTKSFPLHVRITSAGREVLQQTYLINQWSGASIELKIKHNGENQASLLK